MTYANGLTDAGLERLAILAEECGEVIQAVGKILRHGYENDWLASRHLSSNRQHLEEELGNVLYAVELLRGSNDISIDAVVAHAEEKKESIKPYLYYQNLECK